MPSAGRRARLLLAFAFGTPSRRWGWILARDTHLSRDRVASWLARFRELGYDPAEFAFTPQTEHVR